MIKQILLLSVFTFYLGVSFQAPKTEEKMINYTFGNNLISKWLDLRKLNLISFSQKQVTKVQNVRYEGLKNLTRVNLNSDIFKYYFFDKNGKCVLIYIHNEDDLNSLSVKNIAEIYGKPEEVLKSRAGKRANHYVYAKNGFAFSVLNDKIAFFEVFPDSTLEDYKKCIYIKPPIFRK